MVDRRDEPRTDELADEAVLGMDNIALELPVAGAGSRSLAAAIDYVVFMLLAAALVGVAGVSLLGSGLGSGWGIALLTTLFFALYWGYFLSLEVLLEGRTLGKRAVHLRAISRHGGAASLGQLVLRNLLRPIDVLIGVPMMMLDPLGRRLGDRVAGTLVVHDRPADPRRQVAKRIPAGWDAREVAIVENLLARSHELQPEKLVELARRLVRRLEREHPELLAGGPDPERDPVAALRRALAVELG